MLFVALTLDIPPGLAKWFSLVPMPRHVSVGIMVGAAVDYILASSWEQLLQRVFPAPTPPRKGYMKYISKEERRMIEQQRKDD